MIVSVIADHMAFAIDPLQQVRLAFDIAADVRSGAVSAVAVAQAALERIAARDSGLNCFTTVTAERALAPKTSADTGRPSTRRWK